MLSQRQDRITILIAATLLVVLLVVAVILGGLWPVLDESEEKEGATFQVVEGEGFREIADRLASAELIRSATAFKLYALITGTASKFKPGIYELRASLGAPDIASRLAAGPEREVLVRIPEGASVYEVDQLLSKEGVVAQGDFVDFVLEERIEGRLFPDTYKF
ncbi:MAG: endolytic transglycosylase MltG, partial [bacterium]